MIEKILVPALGESITEATVSKWLKSEGEEVEVDEPIVELETDKVNLEVPSPITGTLTKIDSKNGSVVEVGASLGAISGDGEVSRKEKNIKKIEISNLKDNVVNLKTEEKKNEPEIFNLTEKKEEEPLILTNEIKEESPKKTSCKIKYCLPQSGKLSVKIRLI